MQVQNQTITLSAINNLKALPAYADFLVSQKLDAVTEVHLRLAKEMNLPVLHYFKALSSTQLFHFFRNRIENLLIFLKNNQANAQIEAQLEEWGQNQLDLNREHVLSDDITILAYIRKKSFLQFLPEYTSDTQQILDIVQELDLYLLEAQNRATDFYFDLFRQKLDEHTHFIERITNTIPGIIYVYDIINNREIYANHSTADFLGYTPEEMTTMGEKLVPNLIHPEDQVRLREYEKEFVNIKDGEIRTFRYRIKNKQDDYRWLRTTETTFKRDEQGRVVEKIGIAIDVHEQKIMSDELQKKEELYRQAQAIAKLGNWTWDLDTDTIHWSDELFHIFGIPHSPSISLDQYINAIHPDDRQGIQKALTYSVQHLTPFEVSHRVLLADGGIRYINGRGELLVDEKKKPYRMVGTAQDVTDKQLLIEQLKHSEALYKMAQSLAKMGNWTIDLVDNTINWSEEMYRIYELPAGEQMNIDRWKTYLHPDDSEEVVHDLEEFIANKKFYDKVHRILLPGGKVKILHRKAELVCNSQGVPITMVGTTQDVTEQFMVQQELKENQNLIRKITDATPSIISSYNIHTGQYVFVSEGVAKLLGYSTDEMMQKGTAFFYSIIHPDDVEEVNEKQAYALAEANESPGNNAQVAEFTYRMHHKDGRYRWFHTYSTVFDRNNEGEAEHILNITLDVTEQKEATEKIKEQEHFIQQIADASPTILYLFDVATQSMVYVNREVFFVLGYVPEEIIDEEGKITSLLYHPEDFQNLPCRRQSKKSFQQVDSMIQYESRLRSKEGEYRWFLVREIVFKTGERGEIKQILGAALDIHRRKEMERTILQNTLQLEQSNSSLEEFAYVASHDLKEPLRKISTFGDRLMASQSEHLNDEGKIYLRKIVEASQRMQTMISDLLSISMISGNRSFELYSLQKILDETLQTLEFKMEQSNALVEATPLPEAHIIPSQFRQLFQNLLSNSLKFVRPGVQTLITITHHFLTRNEVVHYQLSVADRYLKIIFTDNGIGFENEFAGKIFTIFHRLHGRSEYEGSGIGLAICKKIVTHHGGIIYAESEPGNGARFTIILPA